jgi:anionic cell wall polymer biosynthesis LytR-Cps2A-Psr (LCP) family protein
MLLQMLVDTKRDKAQKQAIKSVCLLLRNSKVDKMPVLLSEVQRLIEENISPDAVQAMNAAVKHLMLLNFLAGAL